MINSINFIDGLDGLSSGVALIAAVTLAIISLTGLGRPAGRGAPVPRSSPGALLGFLRWNFHPASIFIGTSGVMFIGYTLAILSILGSAKVAVALLVLGVPIIDTFCIIVRRIASGRSPFSPGPGPHPPPAPGPRPVAHPDGPAHLRDLRRPGGPLARPVRERAALRVPRRVRGVRARPPDRGPVVGQWDRRAGRRGQGRGGRWQHRRPGPARGRARRRSPSGAVGCTGAAGRPAGSWRHERWRRRRDRRAGGGSGTPAGPATCDGPPRGARSPDLAARRGDHRGRSGRRATCSWRAGRLGDALYMTVISVTTVGFREVRELDAAGRVWTMLMSGTGVVLIFGTVGLVTEYLVTEVTSGSERRGRWPGTVDELRGHFVLCGYGRVGSTVARELVHDGEPLVVIDVNPASLERARDDGHLVVQGDATEDATLRAAGIDRARGLITTIDSDAQNVYVILSARAINPDLFVVGPGEHARGGGEARPGGCGPDRLALHDGRSAPGRARDPAARRRLPRCGALPRRALVQPGGAHGGARGPAGGSDGGRAARARPLRPGDPGRAAAAMPRTRPTTGGSPSARR